MEERSVRGFGLLLFMSLWFVVWTAVCVFLVELAFQGGFSDMLFALIFTAGHVFMLIATLRDVREHQRRSGRPVLELDHDGLRAHWRYGRPNPFRAVWVALVATLPLAIPFAAFRAAPSLHTWDQRLFAGYCGLLGALVVGGIVWHLWGEARAFGSLQLVIRGGHVRLRDGFPLRRTRTWDLDAVRATVIEGVLLMETPDGIQSFTWDLPEAALDALADWISRAGGGHLERPPQALHALRGRALEG